MTTDEYPCLMIGTLNSVVWMTRPREGIVIERDTGSHLPGDLRNDWIMSAFKEIKNPSREIQIKLGKTLLQGKLNGHRNP